MSVRTAFAPLPPRMHGGGDAVPCSSALRADFSTNTNSAGPCPQALAAVQAADCTAYPDGHYHALKAQLAALHGVQPQRVVIAASASEAIARLTAAAVQCGVRRVHVPAHAYGDYAHAAAAWALPCAPRCDDDGLSSTLQWACEPSSPLGEPESVWQMWHQTPQARLQAPDPGHVIEAFLPRLSLRVLDCAYAPLRLDAHAHNTLGLSRAAQSCLAHIWQLWSPNKALGMTGVRGAYLIAPERADGVFMERLHALAPSWPLGTHAVAMLQAWAEPAVQSWVVRSRAVLAQRKAALLDTCQRLGWTVCAGSVAHFVVVNILKSNIKQYPFALFVDDFVQYLRQQHGVRVRDAQSFGLSAGYIRLSAQSENATQFLYQAALDYQQQ